MGEQPGRMSEQQALSAISQAILATCPSDFDLL
jgi:hypothetical protein